jgi:(p)ppGpp synthase/HD superfamily hydrolase
MLEQAIELAVKMHKGQKDKGGNCYIEHPLRVMLSLETEEEKIVGVLHDVIEDSECTKEDLIELGFSQRIAEAVEGISRRENESYMEFIERCSKDELLRKVKLKDIKDNKNLERIPNPTEEDLRRIKKYEKAEKLLLSKS